MSAQGRRQIAVQQFQKTRFSAAVRAEYRPVLALAQLPIEIAQHHFIVDVQIDLRQPDQPRSARGRGRLPCPLDGARTLTRPCPQTLEVGRPHASGRAHVAIFEFQHAAGASRHVGRSMCGCYPRLAAAHGGGEHSVDARPIVAVEPVVELVQQQPVGILHQGARQQGKPLLSIRQRQEFTVCVTLQPTGSQCGGHSLGLRRRDGQEQQIRAMQAGRNQVAHAQVPTVARIFVLQFGADIGNPALRFDQIHPFAAHPITSPCVSPHIGGRPYVAAQGLEQLRLAGAVVAEQRPALPGTQAPGDVTQNPFAAAPHADRVQQHLEAASVQ